MSKLYSLTVRWRRLVARRPWVHWLIVAVCALAGAGSVHRRIEAVDATRNAWGERLPVIVAVRATPAGEPIDVHTVDVPARLVPDRALTASPSATLIARHPISGNQILTELDVGRGAITGPMALVPDGWLAVPVVESPSSGAAPGDPVTVAGDGVVLAEGVVVGYEGDATLVAVPAERAPALPAAAQAATLTLLRSPAPG